MMYKKPIPRLALCILLLSASWSTATAQRDSVLDAFFDRHYEDGSRGLLEHFFRSVQYSASARQNCGVGQLHVRLRLNPDTGIDSIVYLNEFGYGMEKDILRILQKTKDKFHGLGEDVAVEFSISYNLDDATFPGYIKVTAYGIGGGMRGAGCKSNAELQEELAAAVADRKAGRGKRSYEELRRRGDFSEAFADLADRYEALAADR